jgi:hypothetical protein
MDEASKASCSNGELRISCASSIQVLCLVGKINLEARMLETKRRTQSFMNGNGRRESLKQSLKHLPFCTSRGAFSLAFCVSYEERAVLTPTKFIKAAWTRGI